MVLLAASVAASFTSAAPVKVHRKNRETKRLLQVAISSAATVKLQGRLDPNIGWQDLASVTVSGFTSVDLTPEVQLVVSGNNGTVSASVDTD